MIRALPFCAALLALATVSRAGAGPEPTENVIRLTVPTAAEPKPALRYQLLPELAEMNPGNAIQGYMKCFAEQHNLFFNREVHAQQEKWSAMPLKDLPLDELRNYGGAALRQADHAARLEHADWQTLIPLRRDGINLLVPDVAQMRTLALVLRVRLRAEIAENRFDDVIGTTKTLLALARHLEEHPTLIGSLVGIAVASTTLDGLDEMLGQPGCPNLYWALTTLPSPLITLRNGIQGERMVLAGLLGDIDPRTPMTAGQMQKVVKTAVEIFRLPNEAKQPRWDLEAWVAERAGDATVVAAARKRLLEYGVAADAVNQFPALQVILLDEKFLCMAQRDTAEKLMALPYWQAQALQPALLPKAERPKTLYADLVPAYTNVQRAQARIEQRIALLRCVEGLRLYAAAHDGTLPAKLADVPVPLPVDPMTGKAFIYALTGGTATVRGTPPAGMEKRAPYNVRYEIKIAK